MVNYVPIQPLEMTVPHLLLRYSFEMEISDLSVGAYVLCEVFRGSRADAGCKLVSMPCGSKTITVDSQDKLQAAVNQLRGWLLEERSSVYKRVHF